MHVLFWVVALLLLSAAVGMGAVAWRLARGARDRESARVELLRALALPDASAVPAAGPSIPDWTGDHETEPAPAVDVDAYEPAAPIFAERPAPVAALPRWVSLAGVGATFALGVTLYAAIAGGREAASATTPAARATATPEAVTTVNVRRTAVPDKPIELVSLQYRYGRATAFEVNGLVRNPADGRALSQLSAVVNLVDANGRILTSQATPVERPVLEAGQTSAFSLVFPSVTGTVARYQVEFRVRGRDTIPHVDRRVPQPGTNAPSS